MCMHKVTKRYHSARKQVVRGYKVFKKTPHSSIFARGKSTETEYYSVWAYYSRDVIKCGVWLKANRETQIVTGDETTSYRSGFHIFRTRKDAETYFYHAISTWNRGDYEIVEVLATGIRYEGTETVGCPTRHLKTMIADEMLIPISKET